MKATLSGLGGRLRTIITWRYAILLFTLLGATKGADRVQNLVCLAIAGFVLWFDREGR